MTALRTRVGEVRRIATPDLTLVEPWVVVLGERGGRSRVALTSPDVDCAIQGDLLVEQGLMVPHAVHHRIRATLPSTLLSGAVIATLDLASLPSASMAEVRLRDDHREVVQRELRDDLEEVLTSVGHRLVEGRVVPL